MISSVLAKATEVRRRPYPHVVIEDALPADLYDALAEQFPPMDFIVGERDAWSNRALFYKACDIRRHGGVSELWAEFACYHCSGAFYRDVLKVFGREIRKMFGDRDWQGLSVGVRGIDDFDSVDLLTDAQFGVNVPVVGEPSSVRGPHFDSPRKLYNGLLYFRHPDDRSEGGDFLICQHLGGDEWTEVGRVPYRANILVFFINAAAGHGVSPRSSDPHPRRYMSFAGEMQRRVAA